EGRAARVKTGPVQLDLVQDLGGEVAGLRAEDRDRMAPGGQPPADHERIARVMAEGQEPGQVDRDGADRDLAEAGAWRRQRPAVAEVGGRGSERGGDRARVDAPPGHVRERRVE